MDDGIAQTTGTADDMRREAGTHPSTGLPKQNGHAQGLVIRVVENGPRRPSPIQHQSPKDVPLPTSPPFSPGLAPQSPHDELPASYTPPPPPPPAHRAPQPLDLSDTEGPATRGELPASRSPPPSISPIGPPPSYSTSPPPGTHPKPFSRYSVSRRPIAKPLSPPGLGPAAPSSTYRQPSAASPEISLNDQIPRPRHVSGETVSTVASQERVALNGMDDGEQPAELQSGLQYHHRNLSESVVDKGKSAIGTETPPNDLSSGPRDLNTLSTREHQLRPYSSYSSMDPDTLPARSAGGLSPLSQGGRGSSQGRRSPDARMSYVDLLNVPYPQPAPPPLLADNTHLRGVVGSSASLLSSQQTLDAYRANVKKAGDPGIQYAFAIFLLETAQRESASPTALSTSDPAHAPPALIREARTILQKLADKSYPFAQYYLADGYSSGAFDRKGKPDHDRAFPLFVAATKHGHAEAGYRAGLCYEFGWGTRTDPTKAVQFYRQSAARNHPGAMARLGHACLAGDLGLGGGGGADAGGAGAGGAAPRATQQYREGVKWLKRAAESADPQYCGAPYELGLLHETGYGADVFRDETYAAQLFTQSADLGHPEAGYRLGDAYEHGRLGCPRDPALSVHFYNGAASRGHPLAMMALCAWYMVGAAPVLERDETEAYEWAKRAADLGLPKAEYAVGYFTEMGIGTRRDPLEANVWYVRAADQGDERARHRIAAIRAAASGGAAPILLPDDGPAGRGGRAKGKAAGGDGDEAGKGKKRWGLF